MAQALFPNGENPIGQAIKVKGLKYMVIGVAKREGQSFMGFTSMDFNVIIPYNNFRRLYQTGTGMYNETGSRIGIKGHNYDVGLVELENEFIKVVSISPNPCHDYFNLEFITKENVYGEVNISIINSDGNEVYNSISKVSANNVYNYSINVDDLNTTKGVHFVLIKYGQKTIVSKLLIY